MVEDVEQARTVEVPDPETSPSRPRRRCRSTTPPRSSRVLHERFPALQMPPNGDICYATQNRQDAVKVAVTDGADLVLVVGSQNSSNSNRMVEVGTRRMAPRRT